MQEELARELRRRRAALLKEEWDTHADLEFIGEDRESELEEHAQQERRAALLARLDDRDRAAIDDIHAALQRMIDGSYGRCAECQGPIGDERLRALPTTRLCVGCARVAEARQPPAAEVEVAHPGHVPPDLSLLGDREVKEGLREQIRLDGRIDTEELRIVCRHGIVHLEGALPSEAEHQILRKLVTDVAGLQEVVDHVQVNELLWEREDRTKRGAPEEAPRKFEPIGSEDIVRSTEEGVDYVPPAMPPSEEE